MTDPVLLVVGDLIAYEAPFGATSLTNGQATVAALAAEPGDRILLLGDVSNDSGSAANYVVVASSLAAIKSRISPVPGNHDYLDTAPLATAYFDYFGAAAGTQDKGWYSFDLANDWHVIALNSVVEQGVGVNGASEQGLWLAADLAAAAGKHILAFWHHPVITSTVYGDETFWKSAGSFWQQLHAAGAEIIVNGHSHLYERYSRLDWNGAADLTAGIRQFVVGTGCANHAVSNTPASLERRAGGETPQTIGYLRLTLGSDRYSWEYRQVSGETFVDGGTTLLRLGRIAGINLESGVPLMLEVPA